MGQCIGLGDPSAAFTDDDGELAFLIDNIGVHWLQYSCLVTDQRRGKAREDNRKFRMHAFVRVACFISMLLVVEPDTKDLRGVGDDRRKAETVL